MKPEEFIAENSYFFACSTEQELLAEELVKQGIIKPMGEVNFPEEYTVEHKERFKCYYVLAGVKNIWQLPIALRHLLIKPINEPQKHDIGEIELTYKHGHQPVHVWVKVDAVHEEFGTMSVVLLNGHQVIIIKKEDFKPLPRYERTKNG